jgi:phosphomannomutase
MDIAKYTAAYATFIDRTTTHPYRTIVVGHDARISGPMVIDIVIGTLMGMGFDVVNIGPASTPTTELAVVLEEACGGLILTASHNPKEWNALKLLNENGEFLSAAEGEEVLRIANQREYEFADVENLGHHLKNTTYNRRCN